MSLGLKASADGLTVDLMLGATVLATIGLNGIDAGTLIASAAEAQGLTNTKKIITPDMLAKALQGANQSLAASGYQKLPGGLILQWGTAVTNGSGNLTVTFPIAFPTLAASFSLTTNVTTSILATFQNLLQSSVFVQTWVTTTGAASATNAFRWIAIGY